VAAVATGNTALSLFPWASTDSLLALRSALFIPRPPRGTANTYELNAATMAAVLARPPGRAGAVRRARPGAGLELSDVRAPRAELELSDVRATGPS
jgi:hypothetical protein